MGKPTYKIFVLLFRFSTNSVITMLYVEIYRVKIIIYFRLKKNWFLYPIVTSTLVKSWSIP